VKTQNLIEQVKHEQEYEPQSEVLFAGLYTRLWFNDGLDEELSVEDWNKLVKLVDDNFNWEGLSEAITDEFSNQYETMTNEKEQDQELWEA
jgi:hypothetical protein